MGNFVLTNRKIYLGEHDLTGDTNATAMDSSAALSESTCFGSATVTRLPGLKSTTFQVEGFYNDAATDNYSFNKIGVSDSVLTVAAEGGAAGEVGYFSQVHAATYSMGGSVGDALPFSCSGEINGEVYRGTFLENSTQTSSGIGTGYQLGSGTVFCALHVIAASGTTPTLDIDIESDDNGAFSSPTVRGSFAQATGTTAEWLPLGAYGDDYYRVSWTIGGGGPSFSFVVVLGLF